MDDTAILEPIHYIEDHMDHNHKVTRTIPPETFWRNALKDHKGNIHFHVLGADESLTTHAAIFCSISPVVRSLWDKSRCRCQAEICQEHARGLHLTLDNVELGDLRNVLDLVVQGEVTISGEGQIEAVHEVLAMLGIEDVDVGLAERGGGEAFSVSLAVWEKATVSGCTDSMRAGALWATLPIQ